MDFIVTLPNGSTINYSNDFDESIEEEREAAWDDVDATFPTAVDVEAVY